MTDYKAAVVGGGPAGLACACLLAQDGARTALIAPPAVTDPRTVALMQPAMNLLKFVGVWSGHLQDKSAPLKKLHIVDDTGNLLSAPQLEFAASELGLDAFGWNIPLAELVPALRKRAADLGVELFETSVSTIAARESGLTLSCLNGQSLSANIVVAADGAQSTIRSQAGITTEAWRYDQSALVTAFAHSVPHQFISTEYHKTAGAFTTVPLPGNHSSLVWMDRPDRIEHLATLSPDDLATEIQIETHGRLGRISDVRPARTFPMTGQRATIYASQRVILVGEAAHQFPPIGAQGLNASLRDAGHAADLILAAGDPGSDQVLKQYNRTRRADVEPRQMLIGAMNQTMLSEFAPAALARVVSLAAVKAIAPLRHLAMQQGLAPTSNLPFAMRAV
jgi:2-octaprenyl-6-methoxyphenol hydroxylase